MSRCSRRQAARRGTSQPASSWTRRPGRSQARAHRDAGARRSPDSPSASAWNGSTRSRSRMRPAGELAVSHAGTLTAARVSAPGIEPFLAVSMYAPWRRPHKVTGSRRIFSDASAHRVVSDLSVLVGRESGHRILAAGDLNILHGHGERGSAYWASRYKNRVRQDGGARDSPSSARRRQTDARPIHGRGSSRGTARTSRRITRTARRRTRQPASWTSSSPRESWQAPCGYGRSTSRVSGAPATTAAWKSKSRSEAWA